MEWNAAALGDIEVQVLVKYRMYKLGTNSLARAPIRTESVLLNCWREREREREHGIHPGKLKRNTGHSRPEPYSGK